MKKVILTVMATILFSSMYISCTPPEAINDDGDIETLNVDPANDGTIDDEQEEEPIQD